MKKYIKPEAIAYSPDTENLLLATTIEVNNEEGNGIQRSKTLFEIENDDETAE